MKDWKDIINNDREKFDDELPSADLWSKIDSGMQKQEPKMVRLSSVLRIAASVVLIVGTGLFFYLNRTTTDSTPLAGSNTSIETEYVLSSISPQYREMESYYISRIHTTMDQLQHFTPDEEMMQAIKELDEEFKQLKKDCDENVNRDEIIEAMIQNYRLKLELLEQMLNSLQNEEQTPDKQTENYKMI